MAKKQIYLFCEAGMSTSIMVNKMMEVVEKNNLPLEITAFPVARAQEVVEQEKPIAILLGPQVRFLLDKVQKQFADLNIPIGAIDPSTYGMMDGEKALKDTLKMIKANK